MQLAVQVMGLRCFFFKQKTSYEMRISDWSSDVCSSDLGTGWGEFFIRCAVAHDIAARVEYRGDTLQAATDDVILRVVPGLGGDGGAIALDRAGNVVMSFNTSGMYRGWVHP